GRRGRWTTARPRGSSASRGERTRHRSIEPGAVKVTTARAISRCRAFDGTWHSTRIVAFSSTRTRAWTCSSDARTTYIGEDRVWRLVRRRRARAPQVAARFLRADRLADFECRRGLSDDSGALRHDAVHDRRRLRVHAVPGDGRAAHHSVRRLPVEAALVGA